MKRVEDYLKALETLKKALKGWDDTMSVGMVLWSNDGWVEDSGIRKNIDVVDYIYSFLDL